MTATHNKNTPIVFRAGRYALRFHLRRENIPRSLGSPNPESSLPCSKNSFPILDKGSRLLTMLFVFQLLGCASSPPFPARTILASELAEMKKESSSSNTSQGAMYSMLPLAINFERGDRVPINLFIQGNFVRTPDDAPAAELIVEHPFTMIIYRDRKPFFIFEDGTQHDVSGFNGAVQISVSAAKGPVPLSLGLVLNSE